MKNYIILIGFLFVSLSGQAQSGYLGNLNSAEFKINLMPTILRNNKLGEVHGEPAMLSKLRYALPSFELNYARTIARKIELTAGLEYASMNLIADVYYSGNTERVIDNVRANRIGLQLGAKYYRKGSFSPIGKYIGLSFHFGGAIASAGDGLVYGAVSDVLPASNFFVRKRAVNSLHTVTDLKGNEAFYGGLRLGMGRNYPLGNGLTLNVGITAPLLSFFHNTLEGQTGIRMWGEDTIYVNSSNVSESLIYTLYKYNRILLNMSIKKYF
jgi:hypothetical protein